MPKCGLCSNASKYRCPACLQLSCSVQCVRDHKLRTGCSGQIDPTAFLVKQQLLTTQALDRDYNFLQRIGREIYVDKSDARLHRVYKPRDQWRAGARVHSVAKDMSRHKSNKSRWNSEKSQFEWTVQILHQNKDSVLIQLGDKTIVSTILETQGQPSHYEVVLRDAFGRRHVLPRSKTFQDAIRGKDVLEFPTIEFIESVERSDDDFSSDVSSESSVSSDDSGENDDNEVVKTPVTLEHGSVAGKILTKEPDDEAPINNNIEHSPSDASSFTTNENAVEEPLKGTSAPV